MANVIDEYRFEEMFGITRTDRIQMEDAILLWLADKTGSDGRAMGAILTSALSTLMALGSPEHDKQNIAICMEAITKTLDNYRAAQKKTETEHGQ